MTDSEYRDYLKVIEEAEEVVQVSLETVTEHLNQTMKMLKQQLIEIRKVHK